MSIEGENQKGVIMPSRCSTIKGVETCVPSPFLPLEGTKVRILEYDYSHVRDGEDYKKIETGQTGEVIEHDEKCDIHQPLYVRIDDYYDSYYVQVGSRVVDGAVTVRMDDGNVEYVRVNLLAPLEPIPMPPSRVVNMQQAYDDSILGLSTDEHITVERDSYIIEETPTKNTPFSLYELFKDKFQPITR